MNAVGVPTYGTDEDGNYHRQPDVEDEILKPLIDKRRQERDEGSAR
jgi:hypothetical protein